MNTLPDDKNATLTPPRPGNGHPESLTHPENQPDRVSAICGTCRVPFQAAVCWSPWVPGKVIAKQRHCDQCTAAESMRRQSEAQDARRERAERDLQYAWEKICPVEYRATDEGGQTSVARLDADQPALDDIIRHPLGPLGLILRGDTGTGKTRCMYRLLRAYHIQTPRPKIVAMTAGQFDREARDAAGTFTLSAWFSRLASADVLFIDDLGKGKWSEATSAQFWELVDDRTRNGRPLFITTNTSGETLVRTLGLQRDIAEPLLRRLREHCRAIICKHAVD